MLNETGIVRVRNVNGALSRLRESVLNPRRDYFWREVSPRGMRTMEWRGPFVTEYQQPTERVLWSPYRDANPFFHLMESLWILAGRSDVEFLTTYNKNMANYSDNGTTFHAPYGFRLRNHFIESCSDDAIDQLATSIELLRKDHDTRQVVMSIWDPAVDLGATTKDMPCNDLIMFKVRDGELNMTVCCRSNDAIWGAYGANVVQFSMLQEFIACAVGVEVGAYRQISDSFHVYVEQDTWKKVVNRPDFSADYYDGKTGTFPLFRGFKSNDYRWWLAACEDFCDGRAGNIPFFTHVAEPMRKAWEIYQAEADTASKLTRASAAITYLEGHMHPCDWKMAAVFWLTRRGASIGEAA